MFEWLFDHDRDDPAGDKRIDGIFGIANWFLISGGRRQVAFILFSGVIAVLIALNVIWPFEFRDLLTEQQTVQSLVLTQLSGIILHISVVVSIN